MAFAVPFHELQSSPALTVQVEKHPAGNMNLLIRTAGEAFLPLAGLADGSSLRGCPAARLFPQDQPCLDEWAEFFVRIQHDICDSKRYRTEEGTYSRQFLQYLQSFSQWVAATVTCKRDSDFFTVQFSPALGGGTAHHTWQLRELKQALWLDKTLLASGRWEMDMEKEAVFLSREVSSLLGLGDFPQVISTTAFLDTVHTEDLQTVIHALEQVGAMRTPVYSRSVRADGSVVYFRSFAVPEYGPDGNVLFISGLSQDITEHAQAVESSSLCQQRLCSMLAHSSNLYFVVNAAGLYSYVSPNVENWCGLSPDKMTGKPFGSLLTGSENAARIYGQFQQIMDARSPGHIEFQYTHAHSGKTGWVRMSVSPLINNQGNLLEAIVTAQDITQERIHQEHLLYLQTHDALTDTFNRSYFENELARIQQEDILLVSLVIVDLNGLKVVNDAFGHETGDQLLVETAGLIKAACGSNCIISRIGGDEFAVLLYDTSLQEAEVFGEKLAQSCKTMPGGLLPISISCGIACRKSLGIHTTTLYRTAESRLFNSKLLEARSLHSQVIASLKEAIGVRNVETFEHMTRMENMVGALGKRLGLPANELDRLMLLASLHDIGKVAIPDHIINKPGRLTEEEWVTMRSHSEVGYRIAMASSELSGIAQEIRCHHEHWDGSGYPFGKKGEDIPLLSRIICVVDAYDVMTSRRVYKEPCSHTKALEELHRCAGTQFDPQIASLFLDIFGSLSHDEMQHFALCSQLARVSGAME